MKHTIKIGRQIIELDSTDSTNNYLSKLINTTIVPNGTVILAHEQTKGRGQRGNSWQSNKNENLTFSVYIDSLPIASQDVFMLSISVANALHKTLVGSMPTTQIKWPNDILVNTKKIAGILIENSLKSNSVNNIIIGIGLNINQKKFSDNLNATSVYLATGEFHKKMEVLHAFVYQFQKEIDLLLTQDYKSIKNYYLINLIGFKSNFSFKEISSGNKYEGKIIDVKPNGTICILSKNETKEYQFKEISFL